MMGMAPDAFWTMSLREWHAALKGFVERNGVRAAPAPLSRAELERLMRRFPDGDL